jgi:hypothetical protein
MRGSGTAIWSSRNAALVRNRSLAVLFNHDCSNGKDRHATAYASMLNTNPRRERFGHELVILTGSVYVNLHNFKMFSNNNQNTETKQVLCRNALQRLPGHRLIMLKRVPRHATFLLANQCYAPHWVLVPRARLAILFLRLRIP